MPIDINNDDVETAILKLKAREDSLKRLESISNLGSWEIDLKTKKSIWSDQSYDIYGLDKSTTEPTLELFFSLLIPEDIPKAQATLAKAMQTGEVATFHARIRRADGQRRDILLNGKVIFDENKTPHKLIGSTQDITKQVDIQRDAEEFLHLIEHSTNEIYIIHYDTFEYIYVNKGATQALKYSSDELLKMSIFDINPGITREAALAMRKKGLKDGQLLNRTKHLRKDGSTYHVQSLIHPIKYKDEDAFVIFDTNITKQIEDEKLLKLQAKELHKKANYDTLTYLPNRTLFNDRLSQTISMAQKNKKQFALLFIDLDQFKKINDTLGHNVGDVVLIEAASRLKKLLREEDTLARLGGDEFTIILKNIKNIKVPSELATKIIDAIKEPIIVNGQTLFISLSIGISIFPNDSRDKNDLLKFADSAMYKAKDEGRDNFQFYSSEMTSLAFQRITIENNLRIAIKENQFLVYFQPQFNAITNKIIGMEALVRWRHPELGFIYPDQFIPIAEENGLIIDIDRIVMKVAMKQFKQWYIDGLNPGVLALNLSMRQLNEKDFIPMLLKTINSLEFSPKWLELEVTEGQIMNNPDEAILKLNEIKNLGIEIAIDDFGTGYSSLSYLKKLPLDKLKIDRSFVKDIPNDEDDVAITKAIIALGKSLNLNLIAEGVETEYQKEFLIANGSSDIQGYFYSKPIPMDEMSIFLKENSKNR
ncbi:MAG: EAL domain-containing protein [Campylobacterota bacterium]|nr:EAL domain-containing protein [Campylobacterota bacterium]